MYKNIHLHNNYTKMEAV